MMGLSKKINKNVDKETKIQGFRKPEQMQSIQTMINKAGTGIIAEMIENAVADVIQ
jgi:hypothetical protein